MRLKDTEFAAIKLPTCPYSNAFTRFTLCFESPSPSGQWNKPTLFSTKHDYQLFVWTCRCHYGHRRDVYRPRAGAFSVPSCILPHLKLWVCVWVCMSRRATACVCACVCVSVCVCVCAGVWCVCAHACVYVPVLRCRLSARSGWENNDGQKSGVVGRVSDCLVLLWWFHLKNLLMNLFSQEIMRPSTKKQDTYSNPFTPGEMIPGVWNQRLSIHLNWW